MAANGQISGISQEASAVTQWYNNKSVFITGATGFVGKVLVEKLLNSCPGITKIYILLRRKKDMSPEKRLDQLKQTPVFDYLRKYYPLRMDKIVAITGDILEPELGISQDDQNMLINNVSIVLHSAATVKFDEILRVSVAMNVVGTRYLIDLSKKMTKLEAFVHVSTAYCNCDLDIIEERVYPPPGDVTKIMQYVDCLDDDLLNEITPKLISNRPNTYTFTKALAENIMFEESNVLPIAIVRPSIVTASLKTPMPGWIDNLNGPTGLMIASGKGIVRSILCDRNLRVDFIPVDICCNAVIIAAWNVAKEKSNEMKVYHVSTGQTNPLLWSQVESDFKKLYVTNPFNDVFWYPGGSFKSNRFIDNVCNMVFHIFPAYMIDFLSMFAKKKSQTSLVKVHEKIRKALKALEFFLTHQWMFESKNLKQLYSKLNETDKKLFDVDVDKIQWNAYIEQYFKGIKKYILKEDESNSDKAKQHLKKMYVVHCITQTMIIAILMKCFLSNFDIMRRMSYGFISYMLQFIRKFTEISGK